MKVIRKNVQPKQRRKGAALVEYALLVAGVALIGAAAVSVFGHKASDMIGATAAVLPGAHSDDNGPMVSGKLIETGPTDGTDVSNGISLNTGQIVTNSDTPRLGNNVLGTAGGTVSHDDFGGLVLEAN